MLEAQFFYCHQNSNFCSEFNDFLSNSIVGQWGKVWGGGYETHSWVLYFKSQFWFFVRSYSKQQNIYTDFFEKHVSTSKLGTLRYLNFQVICKFVAKITNALLSVHHMGSSINDVTQFSRIFDPFPLIVTLFRTVVTKSLTPFLSPWRHWWTNTILH